MPSPRSSRLASGPIPLPGGRDHARLDLPVIVMGEPLGAPGKAAQARPLLHIPMTQTVHMDDEIAERYGMDGFHDSGDDCCIAATCLVHDFTLAKRPDISILSKDSGTVHWD